MEETSELQQERADQRKRRDRIAEIAKKTLSNTALVREQPFSSTDVQQVRAFLIEVAPHTSGRLFPNYWEHILLASLYARKLAEKIPGVNPYEAEVVGLFHDLGRLVAPHRYFRNDLIGGSIEKKAKLRTEVFQTTAPLDRILGMRDPIHGLEDLTLGQKINHVADNFGRRNNEGKLISPDEILQVSSGKRYTNPVWPSERLALKCLNQTGKEDWANRLVYNEALFLKMQYEIDFDEIRSEVEKDFQQRKNQDWLKAVQNAPRIEVD